MDTIELAKTLVEFLVDRVPLAEEPAKRAASAALVVGVMRHVAIDAVRELEANSVDASFALKKDGKFELRVGSQSVDFQPIETGIIATFDGLGISKRDRSLIPLGERIQVLEIPTLAFDDAVAVGRGLIGRALNLLAAISDHVAKR